jgi:Xaa-Pro aminopeptidase
MTEMGATMRADRQDARGGPEGPPPTEPTAEVDLLRVAACVGVTAVGKAFSMVKAGVTLRDLERTVIHSALDDGADADLTVSLEAAIKLTGSPRPFDPDQRLKRGDLVWLQLTGTLKGYCFQHSAVRVVGAATQEQRAFLEHLDEASHWMAEVMRPGDQVQFVRTESRGRVILPAGHGIGRRGDDVLVIRSNQRFVPRVGQVLVVEPIVVSHSLGRATAGQTVVVLEGGTEVLGAELGT